MDNYNLANRSYEEWGQRLKLILKKKKQEENDYKAEMRM